MKQNIKNITQTYCPICFNKLMLGVENGKIPQGLCYTIKGKFYKRDMKSTEKANELHLHIDKTNVISVVNPITFKRKLLPHTRLKLNNKMAKVRYLDEYSKMTKYNMWECSNSDCYYYKCIDEVEYDFRTK